MPHSRMRVELSFPVCPFEQLTEQTPKQKQKQQQSGKGERGKAAEKHWPNVKWKKNLATTKQSETFSPANSISSNPWNQADLLELLLLSCNFVLGWADPEFIVHCVPFVNYRCKMENGRANAKQIFHANRAQLAWEFSRFFSATFLVMKNAR